MRFSTPVLLALPIASVAADSVVGQYKAQFQNFLSSFGSKPANPPSSEKAAVVDEDDFAAPGEDPVAASVPGVPEGDALASLSLHNWKDILFEPVQEGATTPEEWWVFMTGGNKTCRGHCTRAEAAFNETANRFAKLADVDTPHMALINCENEQVLCNSLGGGAGSIWAFEMLPPPAEINIYVSRVNLSSVTPEAIAGLLEPEGRQKFGLLESVFHPFNGALARYGVVVPFGYVLYALSFIPNWAFMFIVSAISRQMMSRRMQNTGNREGANAAPPAAAQ